MEIMNKEPVHANSMKGNGLEWKQGLPGGCDFIQSSPFLDGIFQWISL